MKEVLQFIEYKKHEFGRSPFFDFVRDNSIELRQRLIWIQCFAQFSISFGELNKSILRQEPTDNPIQKIINQHTYEDDHHWEWLLEDLEKLDFDYSLKYADALRFLWGEETQKTRRFSYELFALCIANHDPILRLAIIESIEATGNIGQSIVAKVAQELQEITQMEYRFLGYHHVAVESGHLMGTDSVEDILENLPITTEQRAKAFELVERVFSLFTDCVDELMEYAKKRKIEKPLTLHCVSK